MPTFGWVREDALDGFLAGTMATPDPGLPPEPQFGCPFCYHSFKSPRGLADHLASQHTGSRPLLTVRDTELARQDVIRTPIKASDINVHNATRIEVSELSELSFQPIEREDFDRRLCEAKSGRMWVRLKNEFDRDAIPVVQEYDLTFHIYDMDQLVATDRKFVELLGTDHANIELLDRFLLESSEYAAVEYGQALGDYVLGVLIKDSRPGNDSLAGGRDYRGKLNGALRILQEFDRPLARLICSLIRFSSNDFSQYYETGFRRLDEASIALRSIARSPLNYFVEPSQHPDEAAADKAIPVVPVDDGTDLVLSWTIKLLSAAEPSRLRAGELLADAKNAETDPLDRTKLLALAAVEALRLSDKQSAIEPLRILIGNDCFGAWAEARLQELEE